MAIHSALKGIALILAALALAACSQSVPNPSMNTASLDGSGAAPRLGQLPNIADLDAIPGRSAADLNSQDVLGRQYLDQLNGTLDGDSLVLDSNVTGGEQIAWGLYQFSSLTGMDAHSLSVFADPQGAHESFYVGLANDTHGHWEWFGPSHGPEFDLDLSASHDRYINTAGNLFFVVVTHHGDAVSHHHSTLSYSQSDNHHLPGVPYHLNASDGDFTDHVHVGWGGGDGATGYQLYRRTDANHDEFVLLATVQHSVYDDADAAPGVVYIYKVRAFNDYGFSDFSNTDHGYVSAHGGTDDCPSALSASDGTPHGVELAWSGNHALLYDVFRAPHGSTDFTLIGSASGLSYFDSTAEPGTVYVYLVALGDHCHSNTDTGYRSN